MIKKLIKLYSDKNIPSLISHSSYQKGFTLIELLVVIAILGILAAVLMVALNPAQKIAAGKNSTVKSDLSSLGSQASLFNTDTGVVGVGSYPNTWGAALGGYTFLATAPLDPSGTAYQLLSTNTMVTPGAACATTAANPCVGISFAAQAYKDDVKVVNAISAWCWQSKTGGITLKSAGATLIANLALCIPYN